MADRATSQSRLEELNQRGAELEKELSIARAKCESDEAALRDLEYQRQLSAQEVSSANERNASLVSDIESLKALLSAAEEKHKRDADLIQAHSANSSEAEAALQRDRAELEARLNATTERVSELESRVARYVLDVLMIKHGPNVSISIYVVRRRRMRN